jgi:hypothetical protein
MAQKPLVALVNQLNIQLTKSHSLLQQGKSLSYGEEKTMKKGK